MTPLRPIARPALMQHLTRFARSESGAVTIDWVPITGAMIGLGLVVALNVSTGSNRMGDTTRDTLTGAEVAAVITQPRVPVRDDQGGSHPPGSWNDDIGPLPGGSDTGYFDDPPPVGFGPPGDDGGFPGNSGNAPGNSGNAPGNSGNAPGQSGNSGNAGGCQGIPGVSCSGLGDGSNPGQGSGNNNAGDTPGGQGVNNPGGGGGSASPASGVPETIHHTFPTRVIPEDWGNWRDTTNWFDLQHITGGQPAAFEVWGDGNPAFKLNGTEQTAGFLQWGAQISMDTPPAPGTSNTAYIRVTTANETWVGAYTITREGGNAQPAPPTGPVATFTDHVNIPYYWNDTYQNWFNRPASIPAEEWNLMPYTVSGDGNPLVHSNEGPFSESGTMRWNGVSLRFDTPAPGQTHTIVLQFGDHVGVYTFTRASAP